MSELVPSSDAAEAAAVLKSEAEELQNMLADLQGKTQAFNASYKEEDYAYTGANIVTPKAGAAAGVAVGCLAFSALCFLAGRWSTMFTKTAASDQITD